MAVVLGIAAVATTWAAFQAGQWDSRAGGATGQATLIRAEANRAAAKAVEETGVDTSVWIEWEKSVLLGRDELAGFLRDRFSPALDVAQDEWLAGQTLDADGAPISGTLPKSTPLTLDAYRPPGQEKAEALTAQAEAKLAGADVAGAMSGRYTMQAVLLALVLFFASVATKFGAQRIQMALGTLAASLLIVVVIRLILLPLA